MPKAFLRNISEIKTLLSRLFHLQHCQWLMEEGKWPLILPLGIPDQKTALNNLQEILHWIETWKKWQGPGKLQWCSRDWSFLGRQRLPQKIIFSSAEEIVACIGENGLWQQLRTRYQYLTQQWPQLRTYIKHYYEILVTYNEIDFTRLQKVLMWLIAHPNSQQYIRQLPLEDIDTKWIESHKSILSQFLRIITNNFLKQDFYELTGLKPWPTLIRVRILDPQLRKHLSGLSDIYANPYELSQWDLPIKRVYIVENICTGLAFSDLPGSIVFMGLGYGVNQLAQIHWMKSIPCYYWGDLDTHGFAILNQIRSYLPKLRSLLMDEETLFNSKHLWREEDKPHQGTYLEYLTDAEHAVYTNLRNNTWAYQIRLEQERICWLDAWKVISSSCS